MTIKQEFLDLCNSFEDSFTVERAISQFKEHRDSDAGSPTYLKSIIRKSSKFLGTVSGEYVKTARLFRGAMFRIDPLPQEVSKNYLLLGHRAIPYYSPDLTQMDLQLIDEMGNPLPRKKLEISWETLKKYNLGAPLEHQIHPENIDVEQYYERFLEQSLESREYTLPDYDTSRSPEDQPSYLLDMELSDLDLVVNTFEYRFSRPTSLICRVEDFENGILSVRTGGTDAEDTGPPGEEDEFSTAIANTLTAQHSEETEVFPVLLNTFASHPELLTRTDTHWIHSVLNSDRIDLIHKGFQPEFILNEDRSESMEEFFSDFALNLEFGDLLEKYRDQPEQLISDALEAKHDGDASFDGYMWCIQQLGSECHSALLDLLKEGDEKRSSFAAVALEMTWDPSLENQLKFIATDDRMPESTRNIAMFLLMNYGSQSAQEYTTRIASEEGMLQKEMSPRRALNMYVHSIDGLVELISDENPNNEHILRELINVRSPLLAFLGTPLIYSTRKEYRELGREALLSSGVPGVKPLLNDLKQSPSKPLQRLSGTPMIEQKPSEENSAGSLTGAYMSFHDLSGECVAGLGAEVDNHFHILLVTINEDSGIYDSEYAVLEEKDKPLPELLSEIIPGWEIDLYKIDPTYARQITISAEHNALDQIQYLPEGYRFGKFLMYLSDVNQTDFNEFNKYWRAERAAGSLEHSEDELYAFCRGENLTHLETWIPLCVFNDHDPDQLLPPELPDTLCEDFIENLKKRFRHMGFLLYSNNDRKHADLARDCFHLLQKSSEDKHKPIRDALFQNLEEKRDALFENFDPDISLLDEQE